MAKHILTDVDPETRDCVCSVCGPSSARKHRDRWICVTKQRESAVKATAKRGGVPGSRKHYHRMSNIDEENRTGTCSQCGPVDIFKDKGPWWKCGNKYREFRESYRDRNEVYQRNWAAKNRESVRIAKRSYKARRFGWEGFEMSETDRLLSLEYRKVIANDPCFYCGENGPDITFHVDHYVPLSRGGTDHWWNLVQSCGTCNMRKKHKDPMKFLAELGKRY